MNLTALFTRQIDGTLRATPLRVEDGTSLHGINRVYFLASPKAERQVNALMDAGVPFLRETPMEEEELGFIETIDEMETEDLDGIDPYWPADANDAPSPVM